jgi:hypothetical protein
MLKKLPHPHFKGRKKEKANWKLKENEEGWLMMMGITTDEDDEEGTRLKEAKPKERIKVRRDERRKRGIGCSWRLDRWREDE